MPFVFSQCRASQEPRVSGDPKEIRSVVVSLPLPMGWPHEAKSQAGLLGAPLFGCQQDLRGTGRSLPVL